MYNSNSQSKFNRRHLLYNLLLLALVVEKCYSYQIDSMNVPSQPTKINRKLMSFHEFSDNIFNVEDFGACGGGHHDNTKAFGAAWSKACNSSSATLIVPSNKKFLLNNMVFSGPCLPGFTFQIDGVILPHKNPKRWHNTNIWLTFQELQNFTLTGVGSIHGRGQLWWQHVNVSSIYSKRPTGVHFLHNYNVRVSGLSIENSPKAHLTFDGCENITIHDIKINSPEDSPNTDGIDVGSSRNFTITDSIIKAGDDCVAFGNGCSEMLVRNLTCGPGHGISIGSLGKFNSAANVSNITVDGAKLTGTMNGARIKTWQGGSGSVSNVTFKNIEMVNVRNPIIIDQYYCATSPHSCTNQSSAVQVKNVTFENIHGTSLTAAAVKLACSDSVACRDIILSNITLKIESGCETSSSCEAFSLCENAYGQARGYVEPPSCLKTSQPFG